jgi:4-amino-4-deoxy-L-arabinose transferase-like glycosyltransferase
VLERWRGNGMLALLGLALIKLAAQIAMASRYGFHRDELYYIAAGRHLGFGYVDYPPLTAVMARLSTVLFGHSLVGLRVWPALAGAAVVVLAGLIARELGGGRFAQVFAGLLVVCSPIFLGSNSMLQTVSFDQLTWAVCLYLIARILARGGSPRLWLGLGVAFGTGLETKYTILLLGLGLVVGLLVTPQRRWLGTPWPWLAGLVAAALLAPNLAWQVTHGWPTIEFLGKHDAAMAAENPPTRFLYEQLLLIGFAAVPLWVSGLVELLRRPRFRALGVVAVVVLAGLLLQRAKSYYAGPIYPLLFAAGAVCFERFTRRPATTRWRGWLGVRSVSTALVVSALVALPFSLPVLPMRTMAHLGLGDLRTDYAEMIGWPQLVGEVAGAFDTLPPAERATARVLAGNYGEAGAVDWFGPALGLPSAISGHDTYWFWRPRQQTSGPLVTLGYQEAQLNTLCGSLSKVGAVTNPIGIDNEEQGGPIFICRDLRMPLDSWPSFRRFVS